MSAAACPFQSATLPDYPTRRAWPLDPPPALAEMRRAAPLARVRLWNGQEAWLVTGYAELRALLTDPRVSADNLRPNYPGANPGMTIVRRKYPTFIAMDAPEHLQQRRMLTAEFTVKRIEAMKPRLQAIVDGLLDAMVAKGPPADLVHDLTLALPITAICDLLGVPYADQPYFHDMAMVIASAHTPPERAAAASEELCDGYIGGLIDRKDADPQDDLLSRLVVNQMRPGHLTRHQLIGMARLLLVAGHETSANTMAMGVLALLENPGQKQALIDDPALLPGAVEEILRYIDPAHAGRRRTALADIEIAGVTIRAGEGIIAHNPAADRDPAAFPDPDRFDIRRDARHHVAFGYGPHQCLGQPLARAELSVLLGTLFRRLPGLALDVPVTSLTYREQSFVYGVERVPVRW
ncbi:cytochrome P450 [Paracraurococcus lichenis]|uniref:Cytochrome P450 n=1 Tax=Paracraurococcus lichenis TaxID=3064888 RepID=A0ABT9E8Z7_9PROT|nr:cytochrome P450 [Paracraurococcus sp. LOR1-02]MDO9712672.1 cytochrome P450 [Paracraurococcus sp. LOR1-02]